MSAATHLCGHVKRMNCGEVVSLSSMVVIGSAANLLHGET